jgi:L-ascorbate metabolism protein UlaG (beta-lactamase superfamily)
MPMRVLLAAPTAVTMPFAAWASPPPQLALSEALIAGEGSASLPLQVSRIVMDPDDALGELSWSFGGNDLLHVSIVLGRIYIRTVDPDWLGQTTLHVEVGNPSGSCASGDVALTVLPVNDVPVLAVEDQVVTLGSGFAPLSLAALVSDPDDAASDLHCEVSGAKDLSVHFLKGHLVVEAQSDDWTGSERLSLTVCDPAGVCATQQVTFVRGASVLSMTLIGNAGFVFWQGEWAVAIDGFLSYGVDPDIQERMRTSEAPFDDLDLILVTHSHYDHFDAEWVTAYMPANPDVALVGPQDVLQQVQALLPGIEVERLVLVEHDLGPNEASTFTVAGIVLDVTNYPHSPERQPRNVGYRIHLGNAVVFHTGDIVVEAMENGGADHALATLPVDVFLVPHFLLEQSVYESFTSTIPVRFVVPMHIRVSGLSNGCSAAERRFDSVICFTAPLQERLVPVE